MKTKIIYILFIATSILAWACKPKFEVPDPDKGSIDATRFVAIGTSMTAGFSDGALYYEGQKSSFSNILAEQLKAVGGGEFTMPYVSENSAGIALIPNNTTNVAAKFKLDYKTDCKNVSSLSPVRLSATESYNVFSNNIYGSGPFKNMGVPDAKSFHISYQGYGNSAGAGGYYNPYFERMASDKVNASVLSDALNQNPTFFSLCIGINDALSYALAGGAADSLTTQVRFDAAIDNIVNQLTANGAKGVIGGIPDITKFPFFTTIPYNNLTLDQTQANSLNTVYTPIDSTVFPNVFKAGPNNFVIYDSKYSIGIRPMEEGELILLTTPLDSVKCNSLGSLNPFHNKDILTLIEIQSIRTAIAGYNAKLQAVAQAKGLAYVDLNTFFNTINTGVVYNGVSVNAQFVKGGAFSLDGLNLNPIGNAMLANEFIKAINKTYNSTILQVDVIKYRGTIFP